MEKTTAIGQQGYMFDKSLEELAATEGGMAAEKVRKRNKWVMFATLLSVIVYFICFECISVGDSVLIYFLECLLLFFAYLFFIKFIRRYLSRIHDIL